MATASEPGFDDSTPPPSSGRTSSGRTRSGTAPRVALRDPLAAVMSLDTRGSRRAGVAAGLVGAVFVHVAGAATAASRMSEVGDYAREIRGLIAEQTRAEYDIDVAPPEPPAPAPAPEPPPEPEAPSPEALPPTEPPPAAMAGEALTAEPEPGDELDQTGETFTIVTGPGERFAGGTSERAGTATTAVAQRDARGAAPASTGAGPSRTTTAARRRPEKDLSRPAGVIGSTSWNTCPFPAAALQAQVNNARVTLIVAVDERGRPRSAVVQSEAPGGYGFGARARECALARTFEPARNAAGAPISGTTPPLNVRFTQ